MLIKIISEKETLQILVTDSIFKGINAFQGLQNARQFFI